MAPIRTVVPKFATEAEEAQWWYDNREQHAEEFAQAIKEGRTNRTADLMQARIEAATAKSLDIRLPQEDLELARKLAEHKGLPYQTYIKSLLHEALAREASQLETT